MPAFLTGTAARWIGGTVGLLLIIFLLARCSDRMVDSIADNATEKGVQTERAATNAEGIESVEKGNAVDNSHDSEFDERVRDEFCRDCPAESDQ